MRPAPVLLACPVDGRTMARFRALSGVDELALFGADYADAIAWLAPVMVSGASAIEGEQVAALTIDDGDRLFAALYRALFGETVELRQRCTACPESFELSLALAALLPPAGARSREASLPGGTRLRALTLGDLLAVAEGADTDLLARATIDRGDDDAAAVEAAFERLNPATIETIDTECPHCGARQAIAFDLPRFFLRCAERERGVLLREIHLLARTYGWGLADILSLNRDQRHDMVRLAASATRPRERVRVA